MHPQQGHLLAVSGSTHRRCRAGPPNTRAPFAVRHFRRRGNIGKEALLGQLQTPRAHRHRHACCGVSGCPSIGQVALLDPSALWGLPIERVPQGSGVGGDVFESLALWIETSSLSTSSRSRELEPPNKSNTAKHPTAPSSCPPRKPFPCPIWKLGLFFSGYIFLLSSNFFFAPLFPPSPTEKTKQSNLCPNQKHGPLTETYLGSSTGLLPQGKVTRDSW